MKSRHHPNETSLLSFAAGTAGAAASAVIATHLELCPICRGSVAVLEATGAVMLDDAASARMTEGALSRAFAAIDAASTFPSQPPRSTTMLPDGSAYPAPVQPYLGGSWRWLAPGMRRMRLLSDRTPGGGLALYRIAPGVGLPAHGHRGRELTCVITGSFSDGLGRYEPGDIAENDETHEHRPIADPGQDCICLVASERALVPHTLVARLLQPILRF